MSDSKSSARRKRHRINIGFSPREMAEIERRVPMGERAQWCRERILMSENFRDPVFDIGARLIAEAASHKRLKAHLAKCEERLADVSNTLQLLGDDSLGAQLERAVIEDDRALIAMGVARVDRLLEHIAQLRSILAQREQSARRIRRVEKRDARP